jgi:AcrR family transcriptional regulator
MIGDEMNDRKQHVLNMAHQLFIEKGFQNTSIQDILDYSGISKGTFYNYFSSKNELLIALFKTLYKKLERERNELLIGRDPSDIHIFTQQIELQMRANRKNNLLALFEEVYVSNDADLKDFLKQTHLRVIRWFYLRFIDIFGEEKQPYLLDCAIMFSAMLNHNLKFHASAYKSNTSIHKVVSYTVARIVKLVDEVAEAEEQLISPDMLGSWISDESNTRAFREQLKNTVALLKKKVNKIEDEERYLELLMFIEDELIHTHHPRKYLVESALASLKAEPSLTKDLNLKNLEKVINDYYKQ